MRILIADHRPTARSALRLLLGERLEEVDAVGEAADSEELLSQLTTLRPDVVLLDWDLPGLSSIDWMQKLRVHDSEPKLVILGTAMESEKAALDSGADAFVSKGEPPRRLLTAIRSLTMEKTDAQ